MVKEDKTICSKKDCNNLRDALTSPRCKSCRRKQAKEKEDSRFLQGLCFRCGKNPIQETNSTPPSKSCRECNERNSKIRSGEITTQPKTRGCLCSICGEPRNSKNSWCNSCLSKYRNTLTYKRLCYYCTEPLEDSNKKHCDACSNKRNVKDRGKRHANKLKLFEFFGGKCFDCSLIDDICVYQFHHLNRELKEIEIARLLDLNWKIIMKEVNKGVLMLCANCHCKRTAKENLENRKG